MCAKGNISEIEARIRSCRGIDMPQPPPPVPMHINARSNVKLAKRELSLMGKTTQEATSLHKPYPKPDPAGRRETQRNVMVSLP